MIRITWVDSALIASFQFRQRVRISTRKPSTALISMGMMPVPASATTPSIVASAMGALRVLGSWMLPSSTRKSAVSLSSRRFWTVDCTSRTSPERSCTSSSPGDLRSWEPSKRLKASRRRP